MNTTKDERRVTNFTVAVNDRYTKKDGEKIKAVSYYNCSFWRTEKMATHLKKGTLVELTGRIYANAYVSKEGEAKASLNCHVSDIKILAWPKGVAVVGTATPPTEATETDSDDLPF